MTDPVAVEIEFEIRQVKSMADHSYNVTLNLPEYMKDQVSFLLRHVLDAGNGVLTLRQIDDRSKPTKPRY